MSAQRGRPKKEPSERKEASIRVRLTAAELEAMQKKAEETGQTLSAWARQALLYACGPPTET